MILKIMMRMVVRIDNTYQGIFRSSGVFIEGTERVTWSPQQRKRLEKKSWARQCSGIIRAEAPLTAAMWSNIGEWWLNAR